MIIQKWLTFYWATLYISCLYKWTAMSPAMLQSSQSLPDTPFWTAARTGQLSHHCCCCCLSLITSSSSSSSTAHCWTASTSQGVDSTAKIDRLSGTNTSDRSRHGCSEQWLSQVQRFIRWNPVARQTITYNTEMHNSIAYSVFHFF